MDCLKVPEIKKKIGSMPKNGLQKSAVQMRIEGDSISPVQFEYLDITQVCPFNVYDIIHPLPVRISICNDVFGMTDNGEIKVAHHWLLAVMYAL
jgi:hypothetical protein